MVKRSVFLHPPVLSAVLFVVMTCACLASEHDDTPVTELSSPDFSAIYTAKLHKSEIPGYFYDGWQKSGQSMAVVKEVKYPIKAPQIRDALHLLSPALTRIDVPTGYPASPPGLFFTYRSAG